MYTWYQSSINIHTQSTLETKTKLITAAQTKFIFAPNDQTYTEWSRKKCI